MSRSEHFRSCCRRPSASAACIVRMLHRYRPRRRSSWENCTSLRKQNNSSYTMWRRRRTTRRLLLLRRTKMTTTAGSKRRSGKSSSLFSSLVQKPSVGGFACCFFQQRTPVYELPSLLYSGAAVGCSSSIQLSSLSSFRRRHVAFVWNRGLSAAAALH